MNVQDNIYDSHWLHNNLFCAVAQTKNLYIYDQSGVEIHKLKKFNDIRYLSFLQNHFLLACSTEGGILRYLDISTGTLASEIKMKTGRVCSISTNRCTGILSTSHPTGSVALWTPKNQQPVAKIFCHKGPVTSTVFSYDGFYMATAGKDGKIKIIDIRTLKNVKTIYTPNCSSLSFSQSGYLCASSPYAIYAWKNFFDDKNEFKVLPNYSTEIFNIKFCPYEDLLGFTSYKKFSLISVIGSGLLEYDSSKDNPFITARQRQEAEIKSLLNKLTPDSIKFKIDNL